MVALSRSSCAPRLKGAPDAGQEVDESRGYQKGVRIVACSVRRVRESEGLVRRPVTVCELSGLPLWLTVIGCGGYSAGMVLLIEVPYMVVILKYRHY